jgi:hypothetical protein
MTKHDLYGSMMSDMESARLCIEGLLEITFIRKESLYYCGEYFFYGDKGKENFILTKNADPFDNEAAELQFPQYNVLLYINNTLKSAEFFQKISRNDKFILLRSEEN